MGGNYSLRRLTQNMMSRRQISEPITSLTLKKTLSCLLKTGYVILICLCTCLQCYGQPATEAAAQKEIAQLASRQDDTSKLQVLVDLGKFYINKPGEANADIKAANQYAMLALTLSKNLHSEPYTIASYILLSQIMREQRKVAAGKKHAQTALSLAQSHRYLGKEAEALMEVSNYYDLYNKDEIKTKIDFYHKALPLLRQAYPNSKKLADALKYTADMQNFSEDNLASNINLLKEALRIYDHVGYQQLQDIYDLLGYILSGHGQTREGLKYSLLAAKTAEKFRDSSMTVCAIYNHLAYAFNNLKEDKRTVECLEKARFIADKNHQLNGWLVLSANLGMAYTNVNQHKAATRVILEAQKRCPNDQIKIKAYLITNLLRIYVKGENYAAAYKEYLQLAPFISNPALSNIVLENAYSAIISLLVETGKWKEANEMVLKYADVVHRNKNQLAEAKVEEYKFKVDSAKGDYLSAINHLQKFKIISDSTNLRNHDKQIGKLEVEYQTEKKDREIAQKSNDIKMLKRQAELQAAVLSGRTLTRNLSIAGAGLLALLLLISYNRYQIKQKANLLLSEQQEEINTQNESLKELLTEREWLLKEIHHRVKNNLQIVISLLNSQSIYLKDPAMLDVLRESQNRMNSISLIHQKLYQEDNLSGVFMPNYISDLTQYLRTSFSIKGKISFETTIAPVTLDVSEAVPLGLILNEAITNSIKYAFHEKDLGHIRINLREDQEDHLLLKISDDGAGLPAEYQANEANSLGMNLMRGLSGQLGATFDLISDNGVTILLRWKQAKILVNRENKA